VTGRRSNRPPAEGHSQHRWWQRRDEDGHEGAAASDTTLETAEAAEQERFITEALEDLRDMDVREVMTPRPDVVALTTPVEAADVAQAVRESGHSCFPVINDELDDVVGVLYVNDLFRSRRTARAGLLGTADTELPSGLEISRRIRTPYVIPESRRILAALEEMRRHRRSFAVVVDEHGGVAGVLTVKDLLEPIVGDLRDELDPVDEELEIVRVDNRRWLLDGRVNVDEVTERLGIELPEGDYVTLGGYLFDALGHIPTEGETARVDGWELTIQEMDKRRIAKVVARPVDDDRIHSGSAHTPGPGAADRPADDPSLGLD
jgi:CBS domain containing-hemolysin-like protein